MVHIGIDCRPLAPKCKRQGRGGIGTYTRLLLREMLRSRNAEVSFILLGRACDLDALPGTFTALADTLPLSGFFTDHYRAPRALAAAGAQVLWYPSQLQAPRYQPRPTVITVHDLIPERYPQQYPADLKERLRRRAMRQAVERARGLIAVSETTGRDMQELWGIAPERITVIHEASHPALQAGGDPALIAAVRATWSLPDEFVLYVGGLGPRKTLATALAGMRQLPEERRLPLVLVSGNSRSRAIDRLANSVAARGGPAIHAIGPLSAEELAAVYGAASWLLYPTRYEGCGLPVLDALAAGVPVVASAVAAIREMAGDAFIAVAEETPAAWAAALREAMRSGLRKKMIAAGRRQAAQYSWEAAAHQTMALLLRVGEKP